MTAEDQSDYERFKKLLDRLGKAVIMSVEAETSEIIRRRLFEWRGLPAEGSKDRPVSTQSGWAAHRHQLPNWFPVDNAIEALAASYPFHPSAISVFERKWQALPRFQQTRGILRLLALVGLARLRRRFQERPQGPADHAGRGTPRQSDVPGGGVRAARRVAPRRGGDDRHRGQGVRTRTAPRQGGDARGQEGATPPQGGDSDFLRVERRPAAGGGDTTRGSARCGRARPRHRERRAEPRGAGGHVLFSLGREEPLSVQLPTEPQQAPRRPACERSCEHATRDRVRAEIHKVFAAGKGVERSYFPERTNQVPDRAALTVVVLAPENEADDPATTRLNGDDGVRARLVFKDVQERTSLVRSRERHATLRRGA